METGTRVSRKNGEQGIQRAGNRVSREYSEGK
jgi:hypothetical protein